VVTLWPHQVECLAAIRRAWLTGPRTLAVLATGTGKTHIYLSLLDEVARSGARALVIAHRQELIYQPVERAKEYFPELAARMGIVMAGRDDADAQVVVATVQTLSANGRLDRALQAGPFEYVVADEAHHITSATWLALLERLGNPRVLGLTATPIRTDGDGLSRVFSSVAYRFPINAAIDRGILVPFRALGFTLPITLAGIAEGEDGWAVEPLGDLLRAPNVLEVVYETWRERAEDRQTFAFTASVLQAHDTAAYFRERGVSAAAVDGGTPDDERAVTLAAFKAAEIRVLANCQIYTEGVDVPEASCALMICPTKSDLAYVQKIGRVLRITPAKWDALVLDFAPLDDRNVIMAGDVLGQPRAVKKATEKAERSGVMVAWDIDGLGLVSSVDPNELVVKVLNYLRRSKLAWALDGVLATAGLSETMMLALLAPDVVRMARAEEVRESWTERERALYDLVSAYRLYAVRKEDRYWQGQAVGVYPTCDEAMGAAEDIASRAAEPILAARRTAWRSSNVSSPQILYMRRLGIEVPDGCTKGQAAQLISQALCKRAVEGVRYEQERAI